MEDKMILLALWGFLVAICLFLHVMTVINRRRFYARGDEKRDEATLYARKEHCWAIARGWVILPAGVLAIIILVVNIGGMGRSIEERQEVRRYDAVIAIQQERAEALCTEFSVLLGKTYPAHEKNIFGMITPENIDVYWVRYPQIKANTTAVALTEKIKALKGAYYDLRSERETVLKNLRFRSQTPWLISAVIGAPFEERASFGWWLLLVLAFLCVLSMAMIGEKNARLFWNKIYRLGIQKKICLDSTPCSKVEGNYNVWNGWSVLSVILAVGTIIVSVSVSSNYWSQQISDKQEVVRIERQARIAEEKAAVLSEEFRRILVADYQLHEAELFAMMSLKEMRVYLVTYPELRLADTVIALVGQMNELWGEYYDKQIERETVIARLRYRPQSPWVIQSLVPSTEQMLAEATVEVNDEATIRPAE